MPLVDKSQSDDIHIVIVGAKHLHQIDLLLLQELGTAILIYLFKSLDLWL